jgi:hypothetical protein
MVGSSLPRTPVKRRPSLLAEVRQGAAEEPGQFGVSGHDAGVALGPVLELPPLPQASVVGPFAARIWGGGAEVQFAPVLVLGWVLPLLVFGVPYPGREDQVVGAEVDGFLGAEPGVVHHREERDQPWPVGLLGLHSIEQARAWPGLTMDRRSTWPETLGAVHLSIRTGFASRRPRSIA